MCGQALRSDSAVLGAVGSGDGSRDSSWGALSAGKRRWAGRLVSPPRGLRSIGLTFTAWTTWLERYFDLYVGSTDPGTFVHLWFGKFFSGILSSLVLYAGIVAVSYLVESRGRLAHQQAETARLNEQLVSAQLAALRSQIEPRSSSTR